MKRNFDNNVTVINDIIDKDFLDNLSDGYSSLEDYRRNGIGMGAQGMASLERVKNVVPPADYQRRLIANTNPDPTSKFYKSEYPDVKRTQSAEEFSKESTKNIDYINRVGNVNAGIPPIQINSNIKEPSLDAVRMNDFQPSLSTGVKGPPPTNYRYRPPTALSCSCVDSMNHMRMCPVCARYQNYEKNYYLVIILMIIVVAAIVIFFLLKDIKRLKSLLKK